MNLRATVLLTLVLAAAAACSRRDEPAPAATATASATAPAPSLVPSATSAPAKRAAAQGIAWKNASSAAEVDAAFAQARAESKPVFLYWGAAWCPPCNQLTA